jgi:hypothetical protein
MHNEVFIRYGPAPSDKFVMLWPAGIIFAKLKLEGRHRTGRLQPVCYNNNNNNTAANYYDHWISDVKQGAVWSLFGWEVVEDTTFCCKFNTSYLISLLTIIHNFV